MEKKASLRRDFIYYIVAFALPLILACIFLKAWDFPWKTPEIIYGRNAGGDGIGYAAFCKNLIENNSIWQNSQLGAPFKYEMYDFPTIANLVVAIPIFIIGKIVGNAVNAMYIYILISFSITSILSYYCIRQFNVNRYISLLGAVAYSFIPYKFFRQWGHYTLGNSLLMIPISVCILYWIYSDKNFLCINKDFFKYKRNLIGIIFIIILGIGELYYTYFFCFFVVVVLFIKIINEKNRFETLKKCILTILSTVFILFINLLPSIINKSSTEPPIRGSGEAELYSFKILHLLFPSNTGINFIDREFNRYISSTASNNENATSFIGIFACIGFIMLILVLFFYRYQEEKKIRFLSYLNLAAIFLGSMGGFAYLVSTFIYSQIRAYNRISVFIAFFSIASLCILIDNLKKIITKKSYNFIIIFLITLLTFFSTLFNGFTPDIFTSDNIYKKYDENKYMYDFIVEIENEVSDNAMIYQMPYHKYPEAGPVNKMSDYSLISPYVYSKNKLKWSYGTYRGTLEDRWQEVISKLPLEEKIVRLSNKGFEGIYVEGTAYKDEELESLINNLENILGSNPIIDQTGEAYFFSMKKYNNKFNMLSDNEKKDSLRIIFTRGSGMYGLENNESEKWMWSDKESSLYVINDTNETIKESIKFMVNTAYNQFSNLCIEINKDIFNIKMNNEGKEFNEELEFKPGVNVINFVTDAPKVNAPNDERNLYFRIVNPNFNNI